MCRKILFVALVANFSLGYSAGNIEIESKEQLPHRQSTVAHKSPIAEINQEDMVKRYKCLLCLRSFYEGTSYAANISGNIFSYLSLGLLTAGQITNNFDSTVGNYVNWAATGCGALHIIFINMAANAAKQEAAEEILINNINKAEGDELTPSSTPTVVDAGTLTNSSVANATGSNK